MAKLLILLSLFFLCSNTNSQNIEFYGEDITFHLHDSSFDICGDYHFRNNTPTNLKFKLKYPFPQDLTFGKIDSISCIDLFDSTSVIDLLNQKYMLFKVSIPAKTTKTYRIKYNQQLYGNKCMYILTSMQTWGRPLEYATFQLYSKDYRIDSLSYIPDKVCIVDSSTTIFFWEKTDFMPVRNFEVFFHSK